MFRSTSRATTRDDETRRQVGIVAVVLAFAIANVLAFPSLFSLFVLGAAIFVTSSRLIVSTKFGWNGPAVSARILVDARLRDLLSVMQLHPDWFSIDTQNRQTLMAASSEVLSDAQRISSSPGHVYQEPPARTTVTIIAVSCAVAGVILGILVVPRLSPYFVPLCGFTGQQWIYFLAGLVLISMIFGGVPLTINLVRIAQRRRFWRTQSFQTVEHTIYLWRTEYPETASALDRELVGVAEICRFHPANVSELMRRWGLSRRLLEGRPSWYERLALTPGADLMLNQTGSSYLRWGLVSPPPIRSMRRR